jgi:molybdopterin molybdotransferase
VEQAREAEERVEFISVPEPGAHIRVEGEDLAAGSPLLRVGATLDAERLMVAAAFGHRELLAEIPPRVVMLSTGDELVAPGDPLPLGAVYNSSLTFLMASLAGAGLDAAAHVVPDDAEHAACFVRELLADERPTLVLSTGAVSAGERDFIPGLAARLGLEALFHQVAIRPGKPVFLARSRSLVWLGLPGNPISTAVGWHFFARPLLQAVAGLAEAPQIQLKLANEVQKPEGLRCFFRAEVTGGRAWVAKRQGSAHFGASVNAGAYVVLPEGRGRFPAETHVDAITLQS